MLSARRVLNAAILILSAVLYFLLHLAAYPEGQVLLEEPPSRPARNLTTPHPAVPGRIIPYPSLRWGIATLITLSAGKALAQHTVTYTHQAVLLGRQISARYPSIPLFAIVLAEQMGPEDLTMLESAGYQIERRAGLHPAYVPSKHVLPNVYHDQYMKFWLWNETSYDYIVYFDSDTFFRDSAALDFPRFFPQVSEERVVACPTSWSHVTNQSRSPITWNGGFFILKPSTAMFDQLLRSPVAPGHFMSEYGANYQWFDVSEMGAFMRDLPNFTTPSPIEDYCSDIQSCCVQPRCEPSFHLPRSKGNMIHGLKPDGRLYPGAAPSSIFDHQRLDVFASWGYDPACLLTDFYEPLTLLYQTNGWLP
jgi:hypothetical protein